jgi:AraC-like DNA-binding protein
VPIINSGPHANRGVSARADPQEFAVELGGISKRPRHPSMATIASTVLHTDGVAARERFALWRESMAATHEATLPEGSDSAAFSAFAHGWNLGSSLVIETRATAQLLSRGPRAIRADGVDHYIIRLQRQGRWSGEAGDHTTEATAGTVMVLDMARPSTALGTGIDNINVILPRDLIDAVLPPFDMHGLILQGAPAELLRSYLIALVDALPRMPAEHAPQIAHATCSLVAACLSPSREASARAEAPLALSRLAEIRRYIDRHLGSRDLSPATIGKALGLSRSTLYATCEPLGGVAALIQRRRLERIRAILADPRDHRSISQIAYQHGFVSNTHFSRAFRSAFGCSPSDARAGTLQPAADAEHAGEAYDIWIRRLGG